MNISLNLPVSKKVPFLLVILGLMALNMSPIKLGKASPRTIVVPEDYLTIADAVSDAADGDTVYVQKGTYNEVLVIDKALSLKGEDKETTIINGNSAATVILIRHDNVEVTGFTVIYDETPNSPSPSHVWVSRLGGIHILSASNCSVHGNKVTDCGNGIWLYNANQNSVVDNYITRCDYGIRVETSNSNRVSGNRIPENWGGLWLSSVSNNVLRDNQMKNNTQNFGISGGRLSEYMNDIDSSNTVDGKPIYYWFLVSGKTVPSDAGCVVLVRCTAVKVQGLTLSKNYYGIVLAGTVNSIVVNNRIAESSGGIAIFQSLDDTIAENTVISSVGIVADGNGARITNNIVNASSIGMRVGGNNHTIMENIVNIRDNGNSIQCTGSYNNISRNRLAGTGSAIVGLTGHYNLFYENVLSDCGEMLVTSDGNIIAKNNFQRSGIVISDGSNNTVCGNRITESTKALTIVFGHNNICSANHIAHNEVGVELGSTADRLSNNTFYHNNFVENDYHVGRNWANNTANFWDNGKEGNYWSYFSGKDENKDGISEIPYLVRCKYFDRRLKTEIEFVCGKDNYPLTSPFDVESVTVELPDWALRPSPSPPPSPTQTPDPQHSESFPATWVVAALIAVISISLLVYFTKYLTNRNNTHHTSNPPRTENRDGANTKT